MSGEAAAPVLAPEVVARLQRLRLALRTRVQGRFAGGHPSLRHGSSLDFADHREYVAGDDPRRIDHAAYRRLGRLLVKLYEAEDQAAVRIVVDRTASMRFGSKTAAARGVAAAFAVLAGTGHDRVRLLLAGPSPDHGVFGAGGDPDSTGLVDAGPWFRGAGSLAAVSARLRAELPDGRPGSPMPSSRVRPAAALVAAVRRARSEGPAGPVVVVSDLLFEGWDDVVEALATMPGDALVVHLLGRSDLEPDARGDLRLVDVETGEELPVGIDARALAAHAEARDDWLGAVASACARHAIGYARLLDDESVEDLVTTVLRRLGFVA